ncbi:hypothetical protein SLA2020_315530 [Shorea laevis]
MWTHLKCPVSVLTVMFNVGAERCRTSLSHNEGGRDKKRKKSSVYSKVAACSPCLLEFYVHNERIRPVEARKL